MCDLEVDRRPITLIYGIDLDILNMYQNEVSRSRLVSEQERQTDRDRQTDATERVTMSPRHGVLINTVESIFTSMTFYDRNR